MSVKSTVRAAALKEGMALVRKHKFLPPNPALSGRLGGFCDRRLLSTLTMLARHCQIRPLPYPLAPFRLGDGVRSD